MLQNVNALFLILQFNLLGTENVFIGLDCYILYVQWYELQLFQKLQKQEDLCLQRICIDC
jgi:hypothetical protein